MPGWRPYNHLRPGWAGRGGMKIIILLGVALCGAGAEVHMAWAQPATPLRMSAVAPPANACPNIEAYGGSTSRPDNSAALAAALTASPGDGRCASFPPGRFTFASNFRFVLPSGSASVTLTGAGADVTQLYWPAGGGLTFDYVGSENSVHLRDISLTTGAVGVGAAIVLNQTAGDIGTADNALSDLFDVTIRGADGYSQSDYWKVGVEITRVSNCQFNTLMSASLFIVPNTGTGIWLEKAYLYSLVGNCFNIGSPSKSASYPVGVAVGSTVGGGTITGNLFDNMVAAIVLDRGATGANVQSNQYSNDSTMVRNLGSGNTIGGGSP
jgi:hypothetical protein